MIDFSRARVLVTGGAGFIGSALVWELNRRGCERIVIADFLESSEKWRNLAPLAFEDYLEADDLLARLASKSLGRFDVVLHMGACSSTTERNAAYLVRNNFQFTKDLASAALSSNARFVYASSAATYGDGSAGMKDDPSLPYLHTLRPLNMYGYSKQMFDLYAAQRRIIFHPRCAIAIRCGRGRVNESRVGRQRCASKILCKLEVVAHEIRSVAFRRRRASAHVQDDIEPSKRLGSQACQKIIRFEIILERERRQVAPLLAALKEIGDDNPLAAAPVQLPHQRATYETRAASDEYTCP